MSPKSYAERLRYHARRFEGKRPQNVLKRYEQRLQLGPAVDELQKNAFQLPRGLQSFQLSRSLWSMMVCRQYCFCSST